MCLYCGSWIATTNIVSKDEWPQLSARPCCLPAALQDALVNAEQGQVNLGIMAGERRAALAKAAELMEQKRVLVRAFGADQHLHAMRP